MGHKEAGSSPVLSDRVRFNGVVTTVTLTAEGKLRWRENCLSIKKEVLGFLIKGSKIKIRAVKENGGGISCGGNTGATVRRRSFSFEPLTEDSLRLWSQKLQEFIDSLGRPKRLFVFVNPYGGKKSASKIFIDSVKPLLDDANIDYTVQETKYQLHAKEVAKSLDILRYDGVVCVSGDGILVEVVNGLLEREDWDSAIKMPLGVIPAGTGNGMAKSLLDAVGQSCTACNATLAIIRGHKQSLDVATVSQGQNRFFSVLMLAWGLIADIDIESEKYRWMGSARIDYYAIQRIFRLRRYNGCIKFVAGPGYETFGEPTDVEGETIDDVKSNFVQHKGYCGPTFHMKDFNRKIEGPFVSIWLHNVPWGGEDALAAPDAKFSDGYLDLVVIKDCPKLTLLSLMTELNKGGHVRSPYVLYFKVKAFVLEPGSRLDDPSKEGIIDVDGEVLARGKGTYKSDQKTLMTYNKLHIKVDQGLATVFSPTIP
ncbi:PREDICTED: sphingosine kinase 1-like isoform X1 [Nicotiana attenuata]|uniref:sphingosine kinase n=2 Tax=Nicotiana attenuata TaxID=49451 RepID=A0A314LFA6_NICAT|nr:PREDICTED: sphingosine kinase 1-like isoform X1 [Nicotiana attenuata]OIT40233.1 sphingosine kinase 1 [Nicotiana attenuata]